MQGKSPRDCLTARAPASGIAAFLLLLLSLSLCTAAVAAEPKSVADIANYNAPDRSKMLEDGARKEGALLIYATGTQILPIIERFRSKYPFIKVDLQRSDSINTTRKVIEEYGAGLHAVDAFELSSYGLVVLRDQKLLQPFSSPEMSAFDPSAIEPGRHWISVRESYLGIGYNTGKIGQADAPKSYADLLKPQWKGKMALSGSMGTITGWTAALLVSQGEAFVRKLGEQDIRVYQLTGRALANLMISGEVPLSPTIYNSHVADSRKKGAPLAWVVPGPVPVTDTSAALAAKAPHPHAAMLLIDFLLSQEGQELYNQLGYNASRKGIGSDDDQKLQKLYLANRPGYTREFPRWQRLATDVFLKRRPPAH